MGVALGRYTAPRPQQGVGVPDSAPRPVDVAKVPDAGAEPGPGLAYAAAVDHLARSEVFLASFGRDVRAGRVDAGAAERGQDLLSATQILLDSPATHDPKMRALLEDLELVLAQIAHLRRARQGEEAKIASEAIRERNVLLRLREALPAEPMGN
jgi:hypothetical protein